MYQCRQKQGNEFYKKLITCYGLTEDMFILNFTFYLNLNFLIHFLLFLELITLNCETLIVFCELFFYEQYKSEIYYFYVLNYNYYFFKYHNYYYYYYIYYFYTHYYFIEISNLSVLNCAVFAVL
jgi:hypothetical protein